MRILIVGMLIFGLGIAPVYAYDKMVQPQLDEMRAMYGSLDKTASEIAENKDYKSTSTYTHARNLAD